MIDDSDVMVLLLELGVVSVVNLTSDFKVSSIPVVLKCIFTF